MVDVEYDSDMEDNEGQISVDRYPGNEGKLFRTLKGIIYTSSNEGVTALGHDIKNIGIISPFHSINTRALIEEGVKIDDSLARKHRHTGGLSGHCFQKIGRNIIYVHLLNPLSVLSISPKIYQPVSLSKIVLNYIIKHLHREKFNFKVLPVKFQKRVKIHFKLNDMRNRLNKNRLENETSILKSENLYLHKTKEINDHYSQAISLADDILIRETNSLELAHSLVIEVLKETNDKMEAKILIEMSKLEISILKFL